MAHPKSPVCFSGSLMGQKVISELAFRKKKKQDVLLAEQESTAVKLQGKQRLLQLWGKAFKSLFSLWLKIANVLLLIFFCLGQVIHSPLRKGEPKVLQHYEGREFIRTFSKLL